MDIIVSIITPAYNCKDTIKETYGSILSQTFSNWEWIVVEDHSKDDSFEYIKEIVKDDSKVVLLRTNKNSGAATARNVGIKAAKGKYIAFLDADDMWSPDKLEKQIAFMELNNCFISYSDYDVLYPNGEIKHYKPKAKSIGYKKILYKTDIGCLTGMYNAEALGKVYMPLDCEKREDHGFWLDLTRNGTVAYKISETLATYRIGNQGVSSNKRKMIKYQYRLYRRHEHFNVIKSWWYLFRRIANKVFHKY